MGLSSKEAQRPFRAAQPQSTPGWDGYLLALLVCAVLMVAGLAEEAALPTRVQDVLRHPILGNLLPAQGIEAMGTPSPRPGDPVGLVFNALSLGLLAGYLLLDLAGFRLARRLKWVLLAGLVVTVLLLPAGKLILLRQGSGPASYTHDGGVIQTEITIQYLLQGKNPYVEDYVDTPMAEWGFSRYRTALYHYPYLPWTFLFSAPFYIAGSAAGFYDQRLVYLLLMVIALLLAPQLLAGERVRLALVAALAFNPIMALDLMFGQNDSFVLCWILFSLVAWRWAQLVGQHGAAPAGRRWLVLSAALFGLACASKPTAWFFAPFYGLLLLQGHELGQGWGDLVRTVPRLLKRAWPALAVFGLILGPYLVWDAYALYDDVWRWSTGQGETGYQIWGWGASNFVLALGLVPDRFAQWPFWALELIFALPVLLWFLRRQQRANTLANACWHYGLFLLVFFYTSRFLNENYLGYILAFLALGVLSQEDSYSYSFSKLSAENEYE
jgi:hypothetical protein